MSGAILSSALALALLETSSHDVASGIAIGAGRRRRRGRRWAEVAPARMIGVGGEPEPLQPATSFLVTAGHAILRTVTSRNVGVATLIVIGVFALAMRRHAKRWPTQSETIAFALAMLGLPTATTIFATLVLLPPPEEASEDALVIAGLIGTIAVLSESCSTIAKSLSKLAPSKSGTPSSRSAGNAGAPESRK